MASQAALQTKLWSARDTFQQSPASALSERFLDKIRAADWPCVGSKAALAKEAIDCRVFGRMGDRVHDQRILEALDAFARMVEREPLESQTVHSFVAIFEGPDDTDEARFEALLWSQLQRLHDLDVKRGVQWSSDVNRNPDDPHFSLSLAGHPFFVIGLHPGASRIARRFEVPALVFNSHQQFERLRADGRYQKMQAATRQREIALQGSINPNLADFGAAAETRQYSGRKAEPEWACPFRVRSPK